MTKHRVRMVGWECRPLDGEDATMVVSHLHAAVSIALMSDDVGAETAAYLREMLAEVREATEVPEAEEVDA